MWQDSLLSQNIIIDVCKIVYVEFYQKIENHIEVASGNINNKISELLIQPHNKQVPLAQLEEATDLSSVQCQFKSDVGYGRRGA